MTKGSPVTLPNKCFMCRNMELPMIYERKQYGNSTKKELVLEHKKLTQKVIFLPIWFTFIDFKNI